MSNDTNSNQKDPLEALHRDRSNLVRVLVQTLYKRQRSHSVYTDSVPRRIIHYWNDIDRIPRDVKKCVESWAGLKEKGFELLLFGECQAREFIRSKLGSRYEKAFDKCYHPAMQSDYFRLCYIYKNGGCYVDVDDVYCGVDIEYLFRDCRLKVQPLCYDISADGMVPVSVFTRPGANSLNWIFYFNNNPLIAARSHPVIKRALLNATFSLDSYSSGQLPEIQSTTGPGNLSKSIYELAHTKGDIHNGLIVLREWEEIAITEWALNYRNDERNWRLSNQKEYSWLTAAMDAKREEW